MESAELKEKSKPKTVRVKHCYRRREIYHQWIHDDKYVYTNQAYNVSGHYDMLFVNTIVDYVTRQDIVAAWAGWRKEDCIAIIDRDRKRILVSLVYTLQAGELIQDIPDDYQVFLTEDYIDNPDILSTGELDEVIKVHAKYLIKRFVESTLTEHYISLNGRTNLLRKSLSNIFQYGKNRSPSKGYTYYSCHYIDYSDVVDFVDKYKVKKFDWYKEAIAGTTRITYKTGRYDVVRFDVTLPSIKQIITDKVFTTQEKIKLEQAYFYSKYCYGYGIGRKEVVDKWNALYNREELEKRFKRENIEVNLDNRPTLVYWTDGIKLYHKAVTANNRAEVERCVKESLENERKAREQLATLDDSVKLEAFRKFKPYNDISVIEYQRFYKSYRRNATGVWKTSKLYNSAGFANTQLRFDGEKIETSRYAVVPLSAAISMWRLYTRIVAMNKWTKDEYYIVKFDDKNISVGIYNLRAIMYRKKKTDQNFILDHYEWCIVIGCHYLWIDDFMDFVKYYDLYDTFDIDRPIIDNVETSNNNINL